MASSAGIIGQGTTLSYADTSGGSYTAVGEVINITPPDVECGDVEITHIDSDDDAKEYIAGLLEGGELDFSVNYVKAQHATLYGLLRLRKYWKITLPDDSTFVAYGYLKRCGLGEVEGENRMTSELGIKVSGKPVFTAAA